MNILLDQLPTYVFVNNEKIPIHADFRTGIKFELLMESDRTKKEKLISALQLFYLAIPSDINAAIIEMANFYQGKNIIKKQNNNTYSPSNEKIYSFENDQNVIYAAFLNYYRIDLNKVEDLHWWTFKNLLVELPEDSNFKKILMYRSVSINSNMSSEQQKFYTHMKLLYKLPDSKTELQKANNFASILAHGMLAKEKEV